MSSRPRRASARSAVSLFTQAVDLPLEVVVLELRVVVAAHVGVVEGVAAVQTGEGHFVGGVWTREMVGGPVRRTRPGLGALLSGPTDGEPANCGVSIRADLDENTNSK